MRVPAVLTLLALLAFATTAQARGNQPNWADSLRHVKVNGADLAYLDVGSGEPLVLVHGSLSDYRAWLDQIEPLSKQYRVIAYSRRYHYPNVGGGNGRDYSVALHDKDLVGFLNALHLDSVHLVGHAYGGTVAAWFASTHPERVRSLVLIEPAIPELMTGTPRDSEYTSERRLMTAQTRMALQDGFDELGATRFIEWSFGEEAIMTLPKAIKMTLGQNAPALRMQYVSDALATPFDAAHMAHITCPVLYLEGDKSPWYAKAMGESFAHRLPSTRLITIKRTDHGMMWEDPRAFNRAVLSFLDGNRLAAQ
jgi:pimeloyl-ACP methyl ester carboxylesterase